MIYRQCLEYKISAYSSQKYYVCMWLHHWKGIHTQIEHTKVLEHYNAVLVAMEEIYKTHDKSKIHRLAELQAILEESIYDEMYAYFERKWGLLPQELRDVKAKLHHTNKEFAAGSEEEPRAIQAPQGKRPRM